MLDMNILDILSYLISPPKCASCGATLGFSFLESPLCKKCSAALEKEASSICERCKREISSCLCSVPKLSKSGCLFHVKLAEYYGGTRDRVVNRIVYEMKSERDKALYSFIAKRLSSAVKNAAVSAALDVSASRIVVTYIPRSSSAIIKHGHDQAKLLAAALSSEIGAELMSTVKRKKRANAVMKELSYSEREQAASNAFCTDLDSEALLGCFVIIVDDVITSGSSAASVAEHIMHSGACGYGVVSVGVSRFIKKQKSK